MPPCPGSQTLAQATMLRVPKASSTLGRHPLASEKCISSKVVGGLQRHQALCFSWPSRIACEILVPQLGMELKPLALEAQSLNHWTTREVPSGSFSKDNARWGWPSPRAGPPSPSLKTPRVYLNPLPPQTPLMLMSPV